MTLLVLNTGSSSLKFGVFSTDVDIHQLLEGEFERFSQEGCRIHIRRTDEPACEMARDNRLDNVDAAIRFLPVLLEDLGYNRFDAIGHRVVHGGPHHHSTTMIDEAVMQSIADVTPLSLRHNPTNLLGIHCCQQHWPSTPQYAVFDTAFHQTMPEVAKTYAIPEAWRSAGAQRYGFHGISHQHVTQCVARTLEIPTAALRLVSLHLGNGASACAIKHGQSVDTSMGMTPLSGLVMGTRAGDLDPGLPIVIARQLQLSTEEIEYALYTNSGLRALTGRQDLRDIEQLARNGVGDAKLALALYAYQVRKYLGAYAAVLGGLNAIAFTGGVGENSAAMRQRICEGLEFLGIRLDAERNANLQLSDNKANNIAKLDSPVKVLVVKAAEAQAIAREVYRQLVTDSRDVGITPPA